MRSNPKPSQRYSFTIDEPTRAPLIGIVDVTVEMDGKRRWMFFITPQQLASAEDYVPGTRVRVHLGERHMIVVSELSEAIIDAVLKSLAADGELEARTLPLQGSSYE